MNLLGEYQNGNYQVSIFDDGTKIRETEADVFLPTFPECMDIKITNYCDMGCLYCHENSTKNGLHGDILHAKFIDTLYPYTELAIGGGNPLSHPDLYEFLVKLKQKNIIANMTVNQNHFMQEISLLRNLYDNHLIRGLGVSYTVPSEEFVEELKTFPNAVLHIINGVVDMKDLRPLYGNGFKILILGYKILRRGEQYYSPEVEKKKEILHKRMPEVLRGFSVVSFDNLAIEQLDVTIFMTKDQWDEFYMGNEGQFTMYIDMVEKQFAYCSVAKERFELMDNVEDMFKRIRRF